MSDLPVVPLRREDVALVTPGQEMFVLIHTGDEGLIPPHDDQPGVGSGHCFGPFVTADEAEAWQEAEDARLGPCKCKITMLQLFVTRLMATVGPAVVMAEDDEPAPEQKARLN